MTLQPDVERCLAFINCQLQTPHKLTSASNGTEEKRAVTISRQTGSGAHVVAEKLADYLRGGVPTKAPWAVFDKNLVEKVLEDHSLPTRLARFMPEDRVSEIADTMEELFGLHPPSWILVRQTAQTILRLAQLGNVILIGRGAAVITSRLRSVFHVRLVGSLEKRIQYIQSTQKCGKREAQDFIRRQDLGRERYLRKYFGKIIHDPLLYHLVINTDLVPYDEAARMIGDAVLRSHTRIPTGN